MGEVMTAGGAAISQAQERILGVPDGSYAVPIPPELISTIEQFHSRLVRTPA